MPESPRHSDQFQPDPIEDMFNGRFDNDEVNAPEGVWEGIAGVIGPDPKKTLWNRLKIGAGITLVTAVTIAILWYNQKPINKSEPSPKTVTTDASQAPSEQATPAASSEAAQEIDVVNQPNTTHKPSAASNKVSSEHKDQAKETIEPVTVQTNALDQKTEESKPDPALGVEALPDPKEEVAEEASPQETAPTDINEESADPYAELLKQGKKSDKPNEIFVPE